MCRKLRFLRSSFHSRTTRAARKEVNVEVGSDTEDIQLDFLTASGSCFCPSEAVQVEPSQDVIVQAFVATTEELKNEGVLSFVDGFEQLEEVTVAQCVLEANQFETTHGRFLCLFRRAQEQ
jgi:hypothetical protein